MDLHAVLPPIGTNQFTGVEFAPNNKPTESPPTAVNVQSADDFIDARARMDAESIMKGVITGLGLEANQHPSVDTLAAWMAQG
jgi:hypothetical protein